MDSVIAMEGNGPAGGTLKRVGVVISSANPYALDYIASHIMGFSVNEVLTVKNSIEQGLCPKNIDEIAVVGDDIEAYVSDFKKPDSSAGGLIKQLPNFLEGV